MTKTAAESDAPMDFEVALTMRNFPELQDRTAQHRRIARAEMDARYHPLATDYQSVLAWLKGEGFVITREDPSRIAIFARGTVGQVARSFQATFARVSFRGKEHSSAVTAPLLPAAISGVVLGVNGLQPHLSPQKHSRPIKADTAKPFSTTGNGPPFLPSQILTACNAAGVTATGNPAPAWQWQRLPAGGTTWANLTGGGAYSGSATATLTITGTTIGMNGDQFRCIVTNAVGSTISTYPALVLGIPPQITSAGTATFMLGQAGSFTFAASGTPAPAFSVSGLPSCAGFNAGSGTITGTPRNGLGTPFTITVTAGNGFSPAATQQFTLAVQGTFSLWQSHWFGANAGNPATSGSLATPAGDGVPT
ncbi:MAG: protease pro-enzyme activation domain-containing protein [Chthoniobacteraceae bacterium]